MLTKEQREQFIQEIFCEDPEEAAAAYTVLAKMRNGEYDQDFVDIVVQKMRNDYDITDAFYFGKVLAGYMKGEIYTIAIEIEDVPSKDSQIEKNQEKLNKLPYPFKAKFLPVQGAGMNSDGDLSWEENVELLNNFEKQLKLGNSIIPLEVGFTDACTTYFHLYTYGDSMARWIYDSKKVYLLHRKTGRN